MRSTATLGLPEGPGSPSLAPPLVPYYRCTQSQPKFPTKRFRFAISVNEEGEADAGVTPAKSLRIGLDAERWLHERRDALSALVNRE